MADDAIDAAGNQIVSGLDHYRPPENIRITRALRDLQHRQWKRLLTGVIEQLNAGIVT